MKGDGKGGFTSVNVTKSGFFVNKDAKSFIQVLQHGSVPLFVASQNSGSLRVFKNQDTRVNKVVRLRPTDVYAEVKLSNGHVRKQEFYFGNGYLSQSSRAFIIPANATLVTVFNTKAEKREIQID